MGQQESRFEAVFFAARIAHVDSAHSTLFTPVCSQGVTSARPPTRVWEVVRTVAAPPSIVVKCGGVVLLVVFCGVFLVVPCVVCCCSC